MWWDTASLNPIRDAAGQAPQTPHTAAPSLGSLGRTAAHWGAHWGTLGRTRRVPSRNSPSSNEDDVIFSQNDSSNPCLDASTMYGDMNLVSCACRCASAAIAPAACTRAPHASLACFKQRLPGTWYTVRRSLDDPAGCSSAPDRRPGQGYLLVKLPSGGFGNMRRRP